VGLNWVSGVSFYMIFVYMTTYLTSILKFPLGAALTINSINMAVSTLLIPAVGALSDRFGRKVFMLTAALGLALLSYPLYRLLFHDTFAAILAGQMTFAVLVAMYWGPLPATLVEMFPPRERYSALSIGYNTAIALFGGTAPLVATFLIKETGNVFSPSFYLILCAVVSLGTILCLPETALRSSNGIEPAPDAREEMTQREMT